MATLQAKKTRQHVGEFLHTPPEQDTTFLQAPFGAAFGMNNVKIQNSKTCDLHLYVVIMEIMSRIDGLLCCIMVTFQCFTLSCHVFECIYITGP